MNASAPPRQNPTAPTFPVHSGMPSRWAWVASNVFGGLLEIELLHDRESVTEPGLVLALETSLDAPEHVRRQGHVARTGQPVGDLPDVVVDAEDLLEQEHPGP